MANKSTQTAVPVSSPGDHQSSQPLDVIHDTSLRAGLEDEEISSGGIQSLLTLLPATLPVYKGLHI